MGEGLINLGRGLQRVADSLVDREEWLYRRRALEIDAQLSAIREKNLYAQLAISKMELAGAMAYTPEQQAIAQKQMDQLTIAYNEARNQNEDYQKQLNDIKLQSEKITQQAQINTTLYGEDTARFGSLKAEEDFIAAVLNRQQDQLAAVMPNDAEMQELTKFAPTVASTLGQLQRIGASQPFIGRDEQGFPVEEQFQELLDNVNDLLSLDLDDKTRAAFGIPADENVDLLAMARRRMGQQGDVNAATEVLSRIHNLFEADLDRGIIDENGQLTKDGTNSAYLNMLHDVFGDEAGLRAFTAGTISDHLMAFARPDVLLDVKEKQAKFTADAAAREAANRLQGVETKGWKGILGKGVELGRLRVSDIMDFGFGDSDTSEGLQAQTDAAARAMYERQLDEVQRSAPTIPGLRYSATPEGIVNPSRKFMLEGFTGDTGVARMFDPTKNAVVDVNEDGYGFQLGEQERARMAQMLGPETWAAIQALPDDRRRANEAHFAVTLPGGPSPQGVATLSVPGLGLLHQVAGSTMVAPSPWLRGMYKETTESLNVANTLGTLLAGKVGQKVLSSGPVRKLATKFGNKMFNMVPHGRGLPDIPPGAPIEPPFQARFAPQATFESAGAAGRTGMGAARGGSVAEAAATNLFGQRAPLELPGFPQFTMRGADDVDASAMREFFRRAASQTNAARMPVRQPTSPIEGLVGAARRAPSQAVPIDIPSTPRGLLPDQSRAFELVDYTGPTGRSNAGDRVAAAMKMLFSPRGTAVREPAERAAKRAQRVRKRSTKKKGK